MNVLVVVKKLLLQICRFVLFPFPKVRMILIKRCIVSGEVLLVKSIVNGSLQTLPTIPSTTQDLYARDDEAMTYLISEDEFDESLASVPGEFDRIIIQEVFEYLYKSLHIAQYLVRRLKSGALLFFDYKKSDASDLDTLAGLEERKSTLSFLAEILDPVYGVWRGAEESVGLCIGKKK